MYVLNQNIVIRLKSIVHVLKTLYVHNQITGIVLTQKRIVLRTLYVHNQIIVIRLKLQYSGHYMYATRL